MLEQVETAIKDKALLLLKGTENSLTDTEEARADRLERFNAVFQLSSAAGKPLVKADDLQSMNSKTSHVMTSMSTWPWQTTLMSYQASLAVVSYMSSKAYFNLRQGWAALQAGTQTLYT